MTTATASPRSLRGRLTLAPNPAHTPALRRSLSAALISLAPHLGDLSPLDRLHLADELALELRHVTTHRLAADARAAGCTWEAIGDALGVTRQSAQERFGNRE